jgi:hypothetical protein
MSIHTNGVSDSGGWGYHEVPREEFYEELSAVLTEMAELIYDQPKSARQASEEIQNDWFFAGWGGAEDNYRVSLWPAYRPYMEAHEAGEIDDAEYAQMCWPKSNGMPITIYIGDGDAVVELAEDDKSTQEVADSFAELAGIVLVDDWDEGDEEDGEGA